MGLKELNGFQKAVRWLFEKAAGFPVWRGSTTDIPPGGWRSIDPLGSYSQLLEVPSFVGCVRVLKHVVSVPFEIFSEDPDSTVTKIFDHPAYPLLFAKCNRYINSAEMRQAMMEDYCIYGAGYAEIVTNNGLPGGRVTAINPLMATRMQPLLLPPDYETLIYRYSKRNGQLIDYQPEQIVVIKNAATGGIFSRPHVPQQLMQRALDTHAYGGNFMRNQGRPSGILSSEQAQPASEDASKKLRAAWDEVHGNPQNAGKTAVLWKGLKYQAISTNPEEAQYNETIKQLNAEFAGIFGVPLNLIDQTDKTATFASAEQFEKQFIAHCARPLASMIEEAFNTKLFPQKLTANAARLFCKLDLDELRRGDSKAQAEEVIAYVGNGVMSRDEWRRKRGLPAKGGMADQLTVQQQTIPLDDIAKILANIQNAPQQVNVRI